MVDRRSKLEMYYAALQVLASKGPLKMTHLMYETKINNTNIKEILYNFLLSKYVCIKKSDGRFPVGIDGGVRNYYNEVYELTEVGLQVYLDAKKVVEGTLYFPTVQDAKRCFLPLSRKSISNEKWNNERVH